MTERDRRWAVLGVGAAASLCCLGTAAMSGAAVTGAAVTGGAVAGGLGATVVQVAVTVVTVGLVGLAWRAFGPDSRCRRE